RGVIRSFTYTSCFNLTASPALDTLSLHDALPICTSTSRPGTCLRGATAASSTGAKSLPVTNSTFRGSGPLGDTAGRRWPRKSRRSEEHTSELQSRENLVCRLLLEKKNKKKHKQLH